MKSDDHSETSTVKNLADAAGETARRYAEAGAEAMHAVSGKARRMGRDADGYVHASPWLAIGAAAGLGVLAGYLLRGRRES